MSTTPDAATERTFAVRLSRDDVLDGAIEILDRYGLADLTMRRLSGALGVHPGALYWHFTDKQTLLAAITDRTLAPVLTATGDEAAPADRLRELAVRIREALLARRDGAEVASASFAAGLSGAQVREALTVAARETGLTEPEASYAAETLLLLVVGQVLDEQTRMQMDSAGALPPGGSPLDDPAARAGSSRGADRFAFGLDAFLAGLAGLSAGHRAQTR